MNEIRPSQTPRSSEAAHDAPSNSGKSQASLGLLVNRPNWLTSVDFGTLRGMVRLLLGEVEFLAGRLDPYLQPNFALTQRLVFVCLGNINRSAFAHALAEHSGLRAASIGLSTTTGAPAFSLALQTAAHYGLDLGQHKATDFSDYVPTNGDLLLAMEVRHARELVRRGVSPHSIALLGHWARPHRIHIHDPHTLSEAYFSTCFSILHSAVVNLTQDLRRHNSRCVIV